KPWAGWHEDAMATLYGFPLDRLNWPLHNSHRLDVVFLPPVRSATWSPPMNRVNAENWQTAKCSRWRTAILTIGTPIPGNWITVAMETNWARAPSFYCPTTWG